MTAFADPVQSVRGASLFPKGLTLSDPSEPASEESLDPATLDAHTVPALSEEIDAAVDLNRARTPADVVQKRTTQRYKISELNDADIDEIRSRLLTMNRDTRTPITKALDLIDLPRNLIVGALAPSLRKRAEQQGETAALGLGRVNFSDVLRDMGVNNRVAAGLLGFVGDVVFDPLTYLGPAGWGAEVAAKAGTGAVKVGLRARGAKALAKGIADHAAGKAIADDAVRAYVSAKAADLAARTGEAVGSNARGLQNALHASIFGDRHGGVLSRGFEMLGAEKRYVAGGNVENLAADFVRSRSASDPVANAARALVEKYGTGTGRGLRLGTGGEIGSQILHVPFLSDMTVQVPAFTAGARSARWANMTARARDVGLESFARVNPLGVAAKDAYLAIGQDVEELRQIQDARISAEARSAELQKTLSDERPPLPPPPPEASPGPPEPPTTPGPTPIVPGGLEIPPDAPASTSRHIGVTDDVLTTPPPPESQGMLAFDVNTRAQEILDAGDASEMDEALDMARMEQAAMERQAASEAAAGVTPGETGPTREVADAIQEGREEGRQGLLSPESATATGEGPGALQPSPAPTSHRARVLQEARAAFGNVPPEQHDAWSALMDARAEQWAKEAPGRTPDQYWSTVRVEKGPDGGPVLHQLEQKRGKAPRASISLATEGQSVIRALKSPDITSLFHESGHLFLPSLPEKERGVVGRVYKIDPAMLGLGMDEIRAMGPDALRKWTAAHEKWAGDFEKYLAKGKAPVPELQAVFDRLRDWFIEIYKKIIGTSLEKEIDPRIRAVMDRMLGGIDDGTGLAVPAGKTTRSKVWDRLVESVKDTVGALDDALNATSDRTLVAMGSANFYKKIPTELKMALQRPGGESIRRQFIRVVDDTKWAGGEDTVYEAFGGDWDAYVNWLFDLAGSNRRKVLEAAQVNLQGRPDAAFWRQLWESWPVDGDGRSAVPKMDSLNVPSAGPDVAFSVHGDPMRTMLDEDGRLVLVYGDEAEQVPAELIGDLPVDAGSVRRVTDADLPDFDPNGPLFQKDVAGQGGLFGGRVGRISSGEQQGGLFGAPPSAPEPVEIPASDPVRMLNESDAEYKARVAQHRKWAESARNTGTLFQDGLVPPAPISPREAERERLGLELDAYREQEAAVLARARERVDALSAAFDQAVPADGAVALESVNDVLALGESLRDAQAMLARAQDQAHSGRIAKALHLDLDDPASSAEQVGEELYHLAANDPEAIDALGEMASLRMQAAHDYAQATKSVLGSVLDREESILVRTAQIMLGTDDITIAASAMAPAGRFLRDRLGEDSMAASAAESIDRSFSRTFGVRGGFMQREIANQRAAFKKAGETELRIAGEFNKRLSDIPGVTPENLPAARSLATAELYAQRDPERQAFYWWRLNADGTRGGPSAMAQRIEEARSSGLFSPETHARIRAVAKQAMDDIDGLADVEQKSWILGRLRGWYVPNRFTDEGYEAARTHRMADKPLSGQKLPAGMQSFTQARTTDQVRFQDPDLLTSAGPDAGWRRFFVMDMPLLERRIDTLTPEQAETRGAIERYQELVAKDAGFAVKNPPRPTDPFELEEMFQSGRFRSMIGDKPISQLWDSDLPSLMGERMGEHQRQMASAHMAQMLIDQSHQIDPTILSNTGNAAGVSAKLRGGLDVTLTGELSTNLGGKTYGVKIGPTVYRRLDPKLWSETDNLMTSIFKQAGINSESLLVPSELADRVEDMARISGRNQVPDVLRAAEKITGMWKSLTLSHPSWPIFNIVGDLWLATSGGARVTDMADPALLRDLFTIRKGMHTPEQLADIAVQIGGREMRGDELLDLLIQKRVISNNLSAEAAVQAVRSDPGLLAQSDRYLRTFLSSWFRMNQFAQDVMRSAAFVSFLKQGNDVDTAAGKVLRSMFDYEDFTRVEETVFRRLFPFYSWMRNNLGYQIALLAQRPSYTASLPKLQNALEEMLAGEASLPQNLRPNWIRDSAAAQVGSDPKSRMVFSLASVIPSGEITNMLAPLFGVEGAMKFAHYFTSNLTPAATLPLQIGTGIDFYSGRSIAPDSASGDMGVTGLLLNQVRPLAEVSRLAGAYEKGGAGLAAGRAFFGGRVQAFDQERVDSSIRRQFRDEEMRLRSAIRRAERDQDHEQSVAARSRLMAMYSDALRRGLDDIVPQWAEDQLAQTGVPA